MSGLNAPKGGEDVTVAYIGGSITQGAGAVPINTACYAYKSYLQFTKRYEKNKNINFIKAGVGGTSSELGMIRLDRDIIIGKLYYHPQNIGHTIMADCLAYLFDKVYDLTFVEKNSIKDLLELKLVIGNTFKNVKLLDKTLS